MTYKDLKANYTPIDTAAAKPHWQAEYDEGDNRCLHAPGSEACSGASCDFGKRTQKIHCLKTTSLLHTMCKAIRCKRQYKITGRLDVDAGAGESNVSAPSRCAAWNGRVPEHPVETFEVETTGAW